MKAAQADLAAFAAGRRRPASRRHLPERQRALLPALVRRFKGACPRVDVQLSESASDAELEARLERGEVDLSFVMLPMNDGPLEAAAPRRPATC